MNKQHKWLKFTSEKENDNSFSFLDIKITRHNKQFKTSVYRKPAFSGVFTHYRKPAFSGENLFIENLICIKHIIENSKICL